MDNLDKYFPHQINSGWLLTGYTLNRLKEKIERETIILPICSLGTPVEELAALGSLVLPPLYHEALNDSLKERLIARIRQCFPYLPGSKAASMCRATLKVVELEKRKLPSTLSCPIIAFSVDTAVEEHGPHLPLMTDTIQSYGVLAELKNCFPEIALAPPVEYGHLTWGLPFGLSIDITPEMTSEYVRRYLDALAKWCNPKAIYVVDVHGSIVHRNAIQAGMMRSTCRPMAFRWLHEPLVQFAGERGDQHAGGVETALIEHFNRGMLDPDWWPVRKSELARHQMELADAVALSTDLTDFVKQVEAHGSNGIVGDIDNYDRVNATEMLDRIIAVASNDIRSLQEQLQ